MREVNQKADMWDFLERNWTHFYWLMGEIPPSLQMIVNQLNEKFGRRQRGHNCIISFRNQVRFLLTFYNHIF